MPPVTQKAYPAALLVFGAGLVASLAGCRHGPRPAGPRAAPLASWQVVLETKGAGGFGGVALAADGRVAASFQASGAATAGGAELASPVGGAGVVLFAGGKARWARTLPHAGAVALSGDLVVAAIAGTGNLEVGGARRTLRGDPGAALVGLAARDGADRWVRPVGATGWVVVRALATLPGGDVAAAGSFAGTLRAGDRVLTAGGPSDGFALRLGPRGEVRWAIRIGGERADAITAIAAAPAAGGGLVVGGTFMGTADARGVALEAIEPTSIHADGFVARLGDDGSVAWARVFGGESDDAVAGVAITGAGLIGVAATLREDARVDDKLVQTRGLADAAVLTFDGEGHRRAIAVIGGADYDSASGLTASGDDLVVAASYSGHVVVGDTSLDAAGGDGAVIALIDGSGVIRGVHDVTGAGRETIAGLAGAPGGWAAALRHSAGAKLDTEILGAPNDPYGGAAIVVRGE